MVSVKRKSQTPRFYLQIRSGVVYPAFQVENHVDGGISRNVHKRRPSCVVLKSLRKTAYSVCGRVVGIDVILTAQGKAPLIGIVDIDPTIL